MTSFLKYMKHENHKVTRAQFEENLALKLNDASFLADITPLLSEGYAWEPVRRGPSQGSVDRAPARGALEGRSLGACKAE